MENFVVEKIALPEEGISLDKINNKIEETNWLIIICPLCGKLIWDIVECKNCGRIFCIYCINKFRIEKGDFCPICEFAPFTPSNSLALKLLFTQINLKCPNELSNENPNYLDYKSHLEKCKYRKCYCSNEGCEYNNILKNEDEMVKHSRECEFRIISCEKCKKLMKAKELFFHNINVCPEYFVKCSKCFCCFKRKDFICNKHIKDSTECLKNQVDYYKRKCLLYESKSKKAKKKKKTKDFEIEKERIKKFLNCKENNLDNYAAPNCESLKCTNIFEFLNKKRKNDGVWNFN